MIKAFELLDYARGAALIGDTGYDSNDFRAEIRSRGIKAVIHSKPERKRALPLDRKLYKQRYLVERFFHSLKCFRAIATRFEKTARNFLALLHVACSVLWLASLIACSPSAGTSIRCRYGHRAYEIARKSL